MHTSQMWDALHTHFITGFYLSDSPQYYRAGGVQQRAISSIFPPWKCRGPQGPVQSSSSLGALTAPPPALQLLRAADGGAGAAPCAGLLCVSAALPENQSDCVL